ncbi:MAG: PDZ domain-containing protein [Planctomycetia bacterium]|nr:PDZ domain-containing protein [Planctomycetia bacterium]
MRYDLVRSATTWLAGLAVVFVVGAAAHAQDSFEQKVQDLEKQIRKHVLAVVGDDETAEEVVTEDFVGGDVRSEGVDAEEYWLGVACSDVPDKTRDELKLEKGQGLWVMDVVPDSPAAKAGLKKGDVLVMAGDVALADVKDLVKKVQSVKDAGDLKIIVIRGGEKKEITAKPEKRDVKRRTIELRKGPFNVQILRPGHVLPPHMNLRWRHDLPEDMTVTITHHGKEPAKIAVKQGDKSWEVTEDKIDELPEDVRKHVDPMVGRFTMKLPAPVGDVLTYVPDAEEFHLRIREAKEAAKAAAAKAEDEVRHAAKAAAKAEEEGKKHSYEAIEHAKQRAVEVRRAAEKQIRDAERAAEDAARGAVKRSFEETRRLREDQLDKRFEELNRRMDELRKAIESFRDDRPAKPEKSQSDAPKPEKSEA